MDFFAAQLIYRNASSGSKEQYLIELRMIHAENERAALREAHRLGAGPLGETSSTRYFIGVKSIERIALDNGTVLFREMREFHLEPVC